MSSGHSGPSPDGGSVPDLLDQLRSAGSHPILSGFPEGAIVAFDPDLRYLCAGGLGLPTVGLDRSMLEGRTIHEVFPAGIVALLEPAYRQALAGETAMLQITVGDRVFIHRIAPLEGPDGSVVAGIGFAFDVTEARRTERALHASERELLEERRRLRDAEVVGHSGSWEWDMATGEITWSEGLFALHGLDPTRFEGGYAQAASNVHADDRAAVDAAMEACRTTEETVRFRYRVARAGDGVLRWFDSSARGVREDGRLVRLVGAVADITDIVQAQEQLTHDALHDSLTGLPNRALLLDRLDAALVRSERSRREIAVLFCDLDGFKSVNDTAGHAAGDEVLVETATRLAAVVRAGDTVARVGGDEFVLVVEPWNRDGGTDRGRPLDRVADQDRAVDRDWALEVGRRIVEAVRVPFRVHGGQYPVTASVGVAFPPLPAPDGRGVAGDAVTRDAGAILEAADAAMYLAKHRGRNRVEVAAGQPSGPARPSGGALLSGVTGRD
jgi:PAS domain S-box-containing protein